MAQAHYGDRMVQRFDAQNMPYANDSFDVVIIFGRPSTISLTPAALFSSVPEYCVHQAKLLIATANKDLFVLIPAHTASNIMAWWSWRSLWPKRISNVDFWFMYPSTNSLATKLLTH